MPKHIPNIIRGDARTLKVYLDDKPLNPKASQKVWNHSPDGFNWGYHGSGPGQLALALCLVYLNDKKLATQAHQPFKRDVISRLPGGEDFTLDGKNLNTWFKAWRANPTP